MKRNVHGVTVIEDDVPVHVAIYSTHAEASDGIRSYVAEALRTEALKTEESDMVTSFKGWTDIEGEDLLDRDLDVLIREQGLADLMEWWHSLGPGWHIITLRQMQDLTT